MITSLIIKKPWDSGFYCSVGLTVWKFDTNSAPYGCMGQQVVFVMDGRLECTVLRSGVALSAC